MSLTAMAAAGSSRDDAGSEKALAPAHDAFYSGRYKDAAALAVARTVEDSADIAAYELHMAAILFEVKRLLGDEASGRKKVSECEPCPALLATFDQLTNSTRTLARARIESDPADHAARFLLGKINLNYVWLNLGPLGRRKGLGEYREARKALKEVLEQEPQHVRAIVAYAWIDYIVDTRVPFGVKWILGGGSRKRALGAMRTAVTIDTDYFSNVEARFGLWEMLIREKDLTGAEVVARDLAREFPANQELARFLAGRVTAAEE